MNTTRVQRWLIWLLRPKVGIPIALVFGLALAPFVYRTQQIAGLPDIGDPFDVEEFLAFEVSDEQNAFVEYREASAAYVEFVGNDGLDLDETVAEGWAEAPESVRQWLEANRPALEMWRKGTEKPNALYHRPEHVVIDTVLPVTSHLRDLARLACLEGSRLEEQGNLEGAWELLHAAFRSSRHSGQNGCIIERVIGSAIHRITSGAIVKWSGNPRLSEGQLQNALDLVVGDYAIMTSPKSHNLKFEYLMVDNTLKVDELMRLVDELSNFRIDVPKELAPLYVYFKNEMELCRRIHRQCFGGWFVQIDRPKLERPLLLPGRFQIFDREPDVPWHPDQLSPADLEQFMERSLWGEIFVTDSSSFDTSVTAERARQNVLILNLATQIYQRKHGNFPQNAEQLIGDVLEELPADPFGQSGETIRYHRHAKNVLVWSIGANGVDDGGQFSEDHEKGDLGFELPIVEVTDSP